MRRWIRCVCAAGSAVTSACGEDGSEEPRAYASTDAATATDGPMGTDGRAASNAAVEDAVRAVATVLAARRWPRLSHAAAAVSALLLFVLPAEAWAQDDDSFVLAQVLENAGPPMTADEAVTRALAHAPAARAAHARSEAADARTAASRAELWPTVTLQARYTRLNDIDARPLIDPALIEQGRAGVGMVGDPAAQAVFDGLLDGLEAAGGSSFSSPNDQTELLATLTLPLTDTPLRSRRKKRALEAEQRATEAQERGVRDEVALQARLAYYRYARTLGAEAVAGRAEAQARSQLQRIEQLVAAGSASEADRMAAVARLEGVRAQRARLQGAVHTTRVALWTLLGEPDKPVGVVELVAPALDEGDDREALVRRALDARPELAASGEARQALEEAEKAERAAAFPRLLAQANVAYANPNLRYLPPEQQFQYSWDVSVILAWSPNQSAISRRKAAALEAQQAAIRADLAALNDDVRIEVTRAFEDFHAAARAAEAARSAQRAAEEAYRVRRVQLDAGVAITTDVLDADLSVTRARLAFLESTLDQREALARLRRAIGSGT